MCTLWVGEREVLAEGFNVQSAETVRANVYQTWYVRQADIEIVLCSYEKQSTY